MMDHENKPGESSAPLESNSETFQAETTPAATGYTGQPDDLHDLFGSKLAAEAGDEDDPLADLRNDPNYSALIRDLEYIATQARLLFEPAQEAPSDHVWRNIVEELNKKPDETE